MAKSDGRVGKRYARALFELSKPEELEGRRDALSALATMCLDHKGLKVALGNPATSPDERSAIARDLAHMTRANDSIFANFVATMLVNGRLSALSATSQAFADMIAEFRRALGLQITTAFPLSDAERGSIEGELRKQIPQAYASFVSVEWNENSKLLGGMVVKAGDSVLDGSLAGSLDRIARSFA